MWKATSCMSFEVLRGFALVRSENGSWAEMAEEVELTKTVIEYKVQELQERSGKGESRNQNIFFAVESYKKHS